MVKQLQRQPSFPPRFDYGITNHQSLSDKRTLVVHNRDKALRHVEFLDGAGQCKALERVQSYVLLDADVVSRFGEPVAYTVDRGLIGEHRPYWFEGEEFLFVDYHLSYPMGFLLMLSVL